MDNTPIPNTPPMTHTPPPKALKPKRIPTFKMAIFLIVLGSILAFIGHRTGSGDASIYWSNGFRVHESTRADNVAQQLSNNIQGININATSANIHVIPTTDNQIHVSTRDIHDPIIEIIDGILNVGSQPTTTVSMGFMHATGRRINFGPGSVTRPQIRVYVPQGTQLDTLTIRATSGNITIEAQNATDIALRTNSGNITTTNVTGCFLEVNQTSGNFNATGSHFTTLYSHANSGNARFEGSVAQGLHVRRTSGLINVNNSNPHGNAVTLQTNSGNINYHTATPFNNHQYNVRASSGNIRIDGLRINGRTASGTTGAGAHEININVTSGNATINFSQ